MRRWFLSIALLAVLLVAVALPSRAEEKGAAAVDAAWVKGMKANDVDAVMKCYAPDATAWLPGAPAATGTKAIRATYEGLLSANTVKAAELTDIKEKSARNGAVRWGKFSLTLAPKAGGEPVVMKGRFSEVLERKGGKWSYVLDHASAEPAPAPAPPGK